jgi:plasmid maintenance system antidote protein VapI
MALRVEKAFGLSMDLLLRMQAWHDAARMRARADEIDVRRYQPA